MKFLVIALLAFSAYYVAHATTAEDVKQKTSEAATTAADYTKEQKDQFQKDMTTKLNDLDKELADMKKSASEKSGAAKKEMDQQITALEKKKEGMKKDLDKLSKTSGKAWGHMKEGMSKAWDSLSDSYEKAKSEFNTTK